MNANSNRGEAIGTWIGKVCRGLAAQQIRATHWLIDSGLPPAAAKAISSVAFVLILGILYLAPIVLFCLLLVAAVVAFARNTGEGLQQDWFPKPTDHRDEPFYDPLSYNDDPDPRFEDK